MDKNQLNDLLLKLPKTDLHVHLDGSIRLETIIDLAQQSKIELPSFTVEGLQETVFKDEYKRGTRGSYFSFYLHYDYWFTNFQ